MIELTQNKVLEDELDGECGFSSGTTPKDHHLVLQQHCPCVGNGLVICTFPLFYQMKAGTRKKEKCSVKLWLRN